MGNSLFSEAIILATICHEGQRRKIGGVPYILHPMEVASILGGLTDDEPTIIAGILHDTVEFGNYSIDEINEKFGSRVAELVLSETENKVPGASPVDTWKLRKEESLTDLKKTNDIHVQMIWLADKLANMRSIYRAWLDKGDAFFDTLTQTDKREHEWYYRKVAEYTKPLCDTAAYDEYVYLINKVFY